MSLPRLPALMFAALLLAGASRADDAADFVQRANEAPAVAEPASKPVPMPEALSCTEGLLPKRPGKFCDNVADCMKFCACACTFNEHKWKKDVKDDGSTTCPDMSESGVGMLPPDSDQLHPIPDLPYLSVPAGAAATQDAIDGLRRMSGHLASPSNANRVKYNYTVRVGSCYRRHLEDTVPECGFVLKAKYMLERVTDPEKRKAWLTAADPRNLGLTWPGATPHSGGYGCDLILLDSAGRPSFDWRAGVDGPPRSSIDQKLASALMDEEATNAEVGGKRLRSVALTRAALRICGRAPRSARARTSWSGKTVP